MHARRAIEHDDEVRFDTRTISVGDRKPHLAQRIYISRVYRTFNRTVGRDLPALIGRVSASPPFKSFATAARVIKNVARRTRFAFMARSVCALFPEFSIG